MGLGVDTGRLSSGGSDTGRLSRAGWNDAGRSSLAVTSNAILEKPGKRGWVNTTPENGVVTKCLEIVGSSYEMNKVEFGKWKAKCLVYTIDENRFVRYWTVRVNLLHSSNQPDLSTVTGLRRNVHQRDLTGAIPVPSYELFV